MLLSCLTPLVVLLLGIIVVTGQPSEVEFTSDTPYVSVGDRLYMSCNVGDSTFRIRGPHFSVSCHRCDGSDDPGIICSCQPFMFHPEIVVIIVLEVDRRHFGLWVCEDRYRNKTFNEIQEYEATGNPVITLHFPLVENVQITVTCRTTGGCPGPTHQWYLDGLKVENVDAQKNKTSNDTLVSTSTLGLTPTRHDRGKILKCEALQVWNKNPVYKTLYLDVHYKPAGRSRLYSKTIDVSTTDMVQLECQVEESEDGNPRSDWFYFTNQNDSTISMNSTNPAWLFPATSVHYSGHYVCQTNNYIGRALRSNNIPITVQAPAYIEESSGRLERPLYDDDQFNLFCVASGNQLHIRWIDVAREVSGAIEAQVETHVVHGSFKFDQKTALKSVLHWQAPGANAGCDDVERNNGIYNCVATAVAAGKNTNATSIIVIQVQYPAIWANGKKITKTRVGDNATFLRCDVCSNPPAQFYWTFNGEDLRQGISPSHQHIIYFDYIRSTDFGVYICTATTIINGAIHKRSYHSELFPEGELWSGLTGGEIAGTVVSLLLAILCGILCYFVWKHKIWKVVKARSDKKKTTKEPSRREVNTHVQDVDLGEVQIYENCELSTNNPNPLTSDYAQLDSATREIVPDGQNTYESLSEAQYDNTHSG